ncbi:MAG TPA: palindromic element RPE4 domain-containing protein [Rickettsia endosymbiont of Pyrocoelia pectoralis]|nr:palindromic element RPE4 domain-containing protein [Rickettsia endosymbiont of Pyrocoelia pectoralis]
MFFLDTVDKPRYDIE